MSFRNRYIRFFISSTFADMEPERNVLAQLFRNLRTDYSKIGWTIEYVDLRWGISKESSEGNTTMRICMDELERCKKLSPKPNFIFLIGDRYGWIPVPELLSSRQWNQIYQAANIKEKLGLKTAYKIDSNHLPDGCYILQPNVPDWSLQCVNTIVR